ncbi:PAS domain S-box protein [Sphingomonas sp. GB1N7]|uniref:PAS domain S-box protein n=1 Tax=Parasphingomonas caseinilytica TaxID=3096158 RepID=UPI002FCA52AF
MADNHLIVTDESRLTALKRYRVLDTPREDGFDELAALAAEICETPIAIVNLIAGDRLWFKAEVGLGVDSIPMEGSFCGAAMHNDDFLLVPDAALDERFKCNPLVTAKDGLRFYAGALLKTPEGLPIGTLCVLDHAPRSLTEFQQRALRQLARQVMTQLELRRAILEGEDAKTELERKVTERAMARGRTWQVSPDLMGVIDVDGYFEQSNPAWQTTLGWSEEEVRSTPFLDLIHPDDLARTQDAWEDANERGAPALRFENRYRCKSGGWRWLSWVAVPDDGKVYCSARDITDVKDRETDLANRTAERDRMWETSPDLMLVIDFEGVFRRVNPAWGTILGYAPDELVGRHVNEFVVPDDHAGTVGAYELAAAGGLPVIVNRYRHKDGTVRWISWTAAPAEDMTYATGRDVTVDRERSAELESAQEALRQSQKLEAIGQLTGGVAHDFNNLLTVIRGSVDLLRRDDLTEAKRVRYIDAIGDTADRAAKLTGQLLAFARRQALSADLFDVADSLNEVATMLRTMTGSRIVLDLQMPREHFFIIADKSQFDTAIVNMGINARDAMRGEGCLTIAMGPVSGIPPIRGEAAVAGDFIVVTIADTGGGIAPGQLEAIFEPFFTTKGVGQGTGLGLSQVIGFAKQSGGDIRVNSTPGEGTVFTLYLPRAVPDGAIVQQESGVPIRVDGDGARVLVVEDNRDVGDFATAALRELGYDSELAINAEAALATLEANAARFNVIFSDVVMPGMSGVELAEEVRRRYPDLPVVLTSGYSHVLAQNGHHGFELLHKPYSVEQLSRVLRKAVNWQSSRSS